MLVKQQQCAAAYPVFVKSLTLDPISAREAGTLTGVFLRRCVRTPDAVNGYWTAHG